MEYGVYGLQQKLFQEFNFGIYQYNITPILHEVQTERHKLSHK
jgi:hypothetical protein